MSNDVQFYQTRMGRQFYEVTVPELIRQIARLNDLLALAVEAVEKQAAPPKGGCCGRHANEQG